MRGGVLQSLAFSDHEWPHKVLVVIRRTTEAVRSRAGGLSLLWPRDFANVRFFIERIEWFIAQEKTPVRQVIVDARAIPRIITATEELRDYVAKLRKRGIEFVVAKAHLPLRETASAFGGILNGGSHFSQLADAVEAFHKKTFSTAQ
jgi:hypothetical protein